MPVPAQRGQPILEPDLALKTIVRGSRFRSKSQQDASRRRCRYTRTGDLI